MKSYLGLIRCSARVRRRQNRMTILCIICAVFLVTAIFSMSDMIIRTESSFMLSKHGSWHLKLEKISQDIAEQISARADVTAVGAASVFNYDGEQPYRINEKRAVLYGTEDAYISQISNGITDGEFPHNDYEVMLSPNAVTAFEAQIGDNIILHTPAGDETFTISGFGTEDKDYYANQTYLIGVYMTQTAFCSIMENNEVVYAEPSYYIQFESAANAAKAIGELQSQYNLAEESISENTGVMGMAGQSSNKSMNNFYGIAGILFVLVLLAGVLMISGSMNSNIARRTQFFGMMRCIGASKQQIIRFVRLEALNWCKSAIPIGIIMGTVISWGICGALRYGIGGEFTTMPVFKVSLVGIVSGAAVGIVTVLLAAQSPAKRAAKVSPMSAVSGNNEHTSSVRHAAKTDFGKIDYVLGIHHATASTKNWVLLTASFALSIILFLSFSVLMDMVRLLLPSMNVTSADFVIAGYSNELCLERDMVEKIRKIDGVANAYGSCYIADIPASSSRSGIDHINIVSYDNTLMDYAKATTVQGTLDDVYGDSSKAATVFNKNNILQVGDTIQIGDAEIEISCVLSQGLFGDDLILICSQQTFDRIMGQENYGLIGIQLEKDATEETAAQIRSFENDKIIVTDQRETNRTDRSTYWASRIVCYGFLAIIAVITLFNIINSISMSVSARTRQYGAMRAVGMDSRQLTRMISAEAFTYAVSGLILGCVIGIPLSSFLYKVMITHHFGVSWHLPIVLLAIVTIFVLASASIAVYAPAKRMRGMAITETINEL